MRPYFWLAAIASIPTIKYLMAQGAYVTLCSHMGKPHSIFSAEVKLNKKDQKKVDALPEAVRRAECVVDEHFAVGRELFAEFEFLLLLFPVETEV